MPNFSQVESQFSGLRQEEIARQVGISRPQLANVLQGRFGLSRDVADRLLAVMASLPQRQAVLGLDQPTAIE